MSKRVQAFQRNFAFGHFTYVGSLTFSDAEYDWLSTFKSAFDITEKEVLFVCNYEQYTVATSELTEEKHLNIPETGDASDFIGQIQFSYENLEHSMNLRLINDVLFWARSIQSWKEHLKDEVKYQYPDATRKQVRDTVSFLLGQSK